MHIARLIIRNYCGIKAADLEIPPKGIVITGGNKRGKTSILRSVKACLLAQGVDPTEIRLGEEKSELLVDLAGERSLHVRRSIRQLGNEVSVTGADGLPEGKPQTLLRDIFGQDLDPLRFYLATDKERRQMLYELMPMDVQAEDVMRWTQGHEMPWTKPPGHGLDVIAGLREKYYVKRTAANAAAKESARVCKELRAKVDALGTPVSAVTKEEAAKLLADAQRELNELTGRKAAHEQARAKAGPTLGKIDQMRYDAAQAKTFPLSYSYPSFPDIVFPDEDSLRRQMRADQERLDAMRADLDSVQKGRRLLEEMRALEESLRGIDSMAIPQAELDAASDRVKAAAAALARAVQADDYRKVKGAADEALARAHNDEDLAEVLDEIVRTLTLAAPRELAARADAIPGLAIGEHITLDDVAIHTLSGMEQLRFSVDLAKRVKKEGKVLIVDDMEKLDTDEFPGFVEMAVAGGWQLIGARVTGKEIHIIAIGEEETK